MKTAFVGHRKIFVDNLDERLIGAIKTEIRYGCSSFIMGTHGQFDTLALLVCKQLRKEYANLDVEVVLTSLHALDKYDEWDVVPYSDIKTVMYDIEDVHFKRRISMSNRQMIDECDTLICYVDEKHCISGAKKALCYAKEKGLKIVNLWQEEYNPFYGMTQSEIIAYIRKVYEKFR
ncbi:MAG: hypothetical protein K2M47_06780 [Clostridiales bacterium]|nr:hypothetical protein [Clostridiales bacterium]